jgi:predicted metal-dependent phosphoesterase TrpH
MAAPVTEIDLHVHTTASDGTLSPAALVRYAKDKGLRTIAITDHDTVEGIEEGLQEGRKLGLEVIPGVEVSVDFVKGTMHLLGYYIDHTAAELLEKLAIVQRARAERNLKIVEKLRGLGIDIDLTEIKVAPEHGQIGRPHFAYALVQKGHAQNIQDAFDRYLRKGGPAYVEKFKFSPQEAMHFIIKAGGVTVLAHPFTLNQPQQKDLEDVIVKLKAQGLDGIEAYYPEHSEGQTKVYRALAKKHGLVFTGGSDFHGFNRDKVDIGEGYGDRALSHNLLDELQARREARLKD